MAERCAVLRRTPGLKDDFQRANLLYPDGTAGCPHPGLRNRLAEGFFLWITAAGGRVILARSSEGEAENPTWHHWTPKRYGDWMTHTNIRAQDRSIAMSTSYILHHPTKSRPACPPLADLGRLEPSSRPWRDRHGMAWDVRTIFAPWALTITQPSVLGAVFWWNIGRVSARRFRAGVGLLRPLRLTSNLSKVRGTEFLSWSTCNKLPSVRADQLTYAADHQCTNAHRIYHGESGARN